MSETSQFAADNVTERAAWTTDQVQNLTSGAWFTAEIEDVSDPVRLITELGEDVREAAILHVTDDAQAAGISMNDLVRFTLFGAVGTMKVVKRKNNPTSPQTDFWCVNVVPGKDS